MKSRWTGEAMHNQCTKEQLEKLMEQTGCEIDKMNELTSEKIYGIVFVEEV